MLLECVTVPLGLTILIVCIQHVLITVVTPTEFVTLRLENVPVLTGIQSMIVPMVPHK